MKALQKHVRRAYYHLPVHCGYCGQRILTSENDDNPVVEPCPHTLFIAHSEGIEYLADRVVTQLRQKGYDLPEREADGFIEVHRDDVDDPDVLPYELDRVLEFDDGIVIEAVVGPPSGLTTYIAYAPLDGEE